jgi:hypothetical protein
MNAPPAVTPPPPPPAVTPPPPPPAVTPPLPNVTPLGKTPVQTRTQNVTTQFGNAETQQAPTKPGFNPDAVKTRTPMKKVEKNMEYNLVATNPGLYECRIVENGTYADIASCKNVQTVIDGFPDLAAQIVDNYVKPDTVNKLDIAVSKTISDIQKVMEGAVVDFNKTGLFSGTVGYPDLGETLQKVATDGTRGTKPFLEQPICVRKYGTKKMRKMKSGGEEEYYNYLINRFETQTFAKDASTVRPYMQQHAEWLPYKDLPWVNNIIDAEQPSYGIYFAPFTWLVQCSLFDHPILKIDSERGIKLKKGVDGFRAKLLASSATRPSLLDQLKNAYTAQSNSPTYQKYTSITENLPSVTKNWNMIKLANDVEQSYKTYRTTQREIEFSIITQQNIRDSVNGLLSTFDAFSIATKTHDWIVIAVQKDKTKAVLDTLKKHVTEPSFLSNIQRDKTDLDNAFLALNTEFASLEDVKKAPVKSLWDAFVAARVSTNAELESIKLNTIQSKEISEAAKSYKKFALPSFINDPPQGQARDADVKKYLLEYFPNGAGSFSLLAFVEFLRSYLIESKQDILNVETFPEEMKAKVKQEATSASQPTEEFTPTGNVDIGPLIEILKSMREAAARPVVVDTQPIVQSVDKLKDVIRESLSTQRSEIQDLAPLVQGITKLQTSLEGFSTQMLDTAPLVAAIKELEVVSRRPVSVDLGPQILSLQNIVSHLPETQTAHIQPLINELHQLTVVISEKLRADDARTLQLSQDLQTLPVHIRDTIAPLINQFAIQNSALASRLVDLQTEMIRVSTADRSAILNEVEMMRKNMEMEKKTFARQLISISDSVIGLNATVERLMERTPFSTAKTFPNPSKNVTPPSVSQSVKSLSAVVEKLPLISPTIAHLRNANGTSTNVTVANVYDLALNSKYKPVQIQLARLALASREWLETEGDKTSTTTVNGKVCLLSKRKILQNLLNSTAS